jgi:hypothetical protein
MKMKTTGALLVGGLAAIAGASAASLMPFGPLQAVTDFTTGPLDTPSGLASVTPQVSFSANATVTPDLGSPAGATESYSVTWNSVRLTLGSSSGGLQPAKPVTLDLGTIARTVTVTLPGTEPPGGYAPIDFQVTYSQDFTTGYVPPGSTDGFAVTLSVLSSPIFVGGKSGKWERECCHHRFRGGAGAIRLCLVGRGGIGCLRLLAATEGVKFRSGCWGREFPTLAGHCAGASGSETVVKVCRGLARWRVIAKRADGSTLS